MLILDEVDALVIDEEPNEPRPDRSNGDNAVPCINVVINCVYMYIYI